MDASINLWAVLLAAIAEFIVGAIWYMPLFGGTWRKITGFDKLKPAQQKEAQKGMGPLLAAQFLAGLVTAYVLANILKAVPNTSWWVIAAWVWLGFQATTQVGGVLFGETAPKWRGHKLIIMAGGSLVCTFVAAWILNALR